MTDKTVVISFTLEQQIEVERIAVDAALEFVEKLNDGFKKKERVHCQPV